MSCGYKNLRKCYKKSLCNVCILLKYLKYRAMFKKKVNIATIINKCDLNSIKFSLFYRTNYF